MKKCPKCNDIYADYVDTCPKCEVDIDTGEKITKSVSVTPKEKKTTPAVNTKERRAIGLLNTGAFILVFSFIYAVLSEGFGFDLFTLSRNPNFKPYGLYSIFGILTIFALPYGWLGLLLFWRGKKILPKKISYNIIFFVSLFLIAIGIVVFALTALKNYYK